MDAETNLTRDALSRVVDLGAPRASVETRLTQARASVETGLGLAPTPAADAIVTSAGDVLVTSAGDTIIWSA